jgi:hypothetical protein
MTKHRVLTFDGEKVADFDRECEALAFARGLAECGNGPHRVVGINPAPVFTPGAGRGRVAG